MRSTLLPGTRLRAVHLLFACLAGGSLHGCWDDGSPDAPPAATPPPAPTPAPQSYTVGGAVSGLGASGLVLANGEDTLAVAAGATAFTLPTAVAPGASYAVAVRTQPQGEQCSVGNATGTMAGASVTNVAVTCAVLAHSLGGSISGLPSTGLVLGNGTDTVAPAAGALSFTFASPVAEGGSYSVAVQAQPSGATCSVGSGSGTMGSADVNAVAVTCSANAYHLSGSITGLATGGLVLANGADTVSPASGATTFAFARAVAFDGSYSVTVQQQPAGQACAVAGNFPATMGPGDVTDLSVTCTAVGALSLVAGQAVCPIPDGPLAGHGAGASVPQAEGLAFDRNGNLLAIGTQAKVLQRITPAGDVSVLAGNRSNAGPVDGTGAGASFGYPLGIALDDAGNLDITDQYLMRRVTPAGVVTTLAGAANSPGLVDGTGSAARFNFMKGVATDTAGNAYIADSNNNVIRRMTPAGVVTTFAGGGSAGGSASGFADGTGTAALFSGPVAVVIDAAGNLYVADYLNWAIRKITPAGVVSTLAGGGPTHGGLADGTGSAARFGGTTSLALGPAGSLYVLDQAYSAVRLVTADGVVTTLATQPGLQTGPISPTSFTMPSQSTVGIAADASGTLFMASGCSIQKFGP
ncbi:MAG: hypothetical protein JF586_12055 [Burkholderiales bacterium]|nr:hypothetical protein [Burkholderiales bacterium]